MTKPHKKTIVQIFHKYKTDWKGYSGVWSYLVRVVGVHDASQPKVPDLKYQVFCVDKQVSRLEVSVQHISRVDVLKAPEELVHEESGVALRQKTPLQQLTQVCLHVLLHNVDRVDLRQGHHILC